MTIYSFPVGRSNLEREDETFTVDDDTHLCIYRLHFDVEPTRQRFEDTEMSSTMYPHLQMFLFLIKVLKIAELDWHLVVIPYGDSNLSQIGDVPYAIDMVWSMKNTDDPETNDAADTAKFEDAISAALKDTTDIDDPEKGEPPAKKPKISVNYETKLDPRCYYNQKTKTCSLYFHYVLSLSGGVDEDQVAVSEYICFL